MFNLRTSLGHGYLQHSVLLLSDFPLDWHVMAIWESLKNATDANLVAITGTIILVPCLQGKSSPCNSFDDWIPKISSTGTQFSNEVKWLDKEDWVTG